MRLLLVAVHALDGGGIVSVAGSMFMPAPGWNTLATMQADDQRQRREEQEVGEGLEDDAAQLAEVAHAGDADHDGEEHHRSDDHLHQP